MSNTYITAYTCSLLCVHTRNIGRYFCLGSYFYTNKHEWNGFVFIFFIYALKLVDAVRRYAYGLCMGTTVESTKANKTEQRKMKKKIKQKIGKISQCDVQIIAYYACAITLLFRVKYKRFNGIEPFFPRMF